MTHRHVKRVEPRATRQVAAAVEVHIVIPVHHVAHVTDAVLSVEASQVVLRWQGRRRELTVIA